MTSALSSGREQELDVEVIVSLGELGSEVLAAWDEMAEQRSLPYSSSGWMLAWSREGRAAELVRIVVVRDGERIVGVGPFSAPDQRGPLGLRADYWLLGAGIGPRSEPLAVPGYERPVAAAFARVLAHASPKPTAVRFAGIDGASEWSAMIAQAWPGAGARVVEQDRVPGLQVVMHPDGYEAWLGDRSTSFRRDLRRAERGVAKEGVTLRISATPAEAAADVKAMVEIQRRRFRRLGRPELPEGHERAIADAAALLVERGWARIVVAEAEGRVIAGDANFVAGTRMAGLMVGLDPDWEHISVGRVAFAHSIRDAHELGMRTLDLGAGAQDYKSRFAGADEPLAWQLVRPNDVRAIVAAGFEAPEFARRRARAAVKAMPDDWQRRVDAARRELRTRLGRG